MVFVDRRLPSRNTELLTIAQLHQTFATSISHLFNGGGLKRPPRSREPGISLNDTASNRVGHVEADLALSSALLERLSSENIRTSPDRIEAGSQSPRGSSGSVASHVSKSKPRRLGTRRR